MPTLKLRQASERLCSDRELSAHIVSAVSPASGTLRNRSTIFAMYGALQSRLRIAQSPRSHAYAEATKLRQARERLCSDGTLRQASERLCSDRELSAHIVSAVSPVRGRCGCEAHTSDKRNACASVRAESSKRETLLRRCLASGTLRNRSTTFALYAHHHFTTFMVPCMI
jgi:hypothetical protein